MYDLIGDKITKLVYRSMFLRSIEIKEALPRFTMSTEGLTAGTTAKIKPSWQGT
jgi:hypothetical protein